MSRIPEARLNQIVDRFDAVEARMGVASDGQEIVKLSREHAELAPVVEAARKLSSARKELSDLNALVEDPATDKEMAALADEERQSLKGRIPEMERALQLLLLPKDRDDDANIILEVRAGTGGDEAALFAGDLFRMYSRYAGGRGWKVELMSENPGDAGGYKEIIASVTGAGVFGRMKFESGVHRVQRVPDTEASGRIHTSAATVAVLPAPENIEIEIREQDLRIDTMRSSGAGGQHVNTTDSAVRITHLPTGVVVTSAMKSQHQNRALAMDVLKTRLYDMERQRADSERAAARKEQIGSGDRSQRIRTYNFPQGRVTDHRIGLTTHQLPSFLEGDIDEMIDALLAEDQAAKLAALDAE